MPLESKLPGLIPHACRSSRFRRRAGSCSCGVRRGRSVADLPCDRVGDVGDAVVSRLLCYRGGSAIVGDALGSAVRPVEVGDGFGRRRAFCRKRGGSRLTQIIVIEGARLARRVCGLQNSPGKIGAKGENLVDNTSIAHDIGL